MATALRDTILIKNFEGKVFDYNSPTSATTSETFSIALNNSDDNILLIINTTQCNPTNFTITFDKGSYPGGKAPAAITVADGYEKIIPIESGMIEKKNSTAAFTITVTSGALNTSGIKLAVLKKRFVTNN